MRKLLYVFGVLLMLTTFTACINDDSDFSEIINRSNDTIDADTIDVPVITLDTTDLEEPEEVITTDEDDPFFEDYAENSSWTYTIYIHFDDEEGVTVSGNTRRATITVTDLNHVQVRSISRDVHYVLSGSTTNGELKVYSNYKYKLTLNGVSIHNPSGAAINNQCTKTLCLELADSTTNTLSDGEAYTDTEYEDQKATLFSEGQIIFSGKGTLNVNGHVRNAITSDDYIRFRPGSKINVTCSSGHGIKSNDGIFINGGVLNVEISADGAKGINTEAHLIVDGGRTTVLTHGNPTIEENDTSSCAAIKTDSIMIVNAGTLRLASDGDGGKGINCHQSMTINGGEIVSIATGTEVLAKPRAIKVEYDLIINGGNIFAHSSESKPVDANGTMTIAEGYARFTSLKRFFILQY